MKFLDNLKNFFEGKRNRIIVLSAAAVAVILAIACFTRSQALNLVDFVSVDKVNGLNGQGVISYSIDGDALKTAMFGDVQYDELDEEDAINEIRAQYDEVSLVMNSIKLTVEPDTGLSNGDEVTITAELENKSSYKFSKRFKNGEKTYIVSGLEDGKLFDPFSEEAISFKITGFNGKGEAELKVNKSELSRYTDYTISETTGLSNGDVVTVKVEVEDEVFSKLGYIVPKETEREYKVSELPTPIDSATEISLSTLAEFEGVALEKIEANTNNVISTGYTLAKDPEIVDSFFIKVNDPAASHKDSWYGLDIDNAVLIMTHTTYKGGISRDRAYEYWDVCIFPDCYVTPSGEFKYDEEQITVLTKIADTKEEVMQWLEETFSDMKLTSIEG